MEAEQILIAACAHVDCTPDRVLAHHIYDDYITLVVDRGIAGGPKYTVMLAGLEPVLPVVKIDIDDSIIIPRAGGVNVTRAALHLAEKRGIDLALMTGSGEGGRILKKDVEALL